MQDIRIVKLKIRLTNRPSKLLAVFPDEKKKRFVWPVANSRAALVGAIKLTALWMVGMMLALPLFSAFESHIVNVTAELRQVDPPVISPPGAGTAWNNQMGSVDLTGTVTLNFSDSDVDAQYIYYTFGAGTVESLVPAPVCGDVLGGPKASVPALNISSNTTVKALACDGNTAVAHQSVINTKIYVFKAANDPPSGASCANRTAPLDVMLILDHSGSMDATKIDAAKTAGKSFLDNLSAPRDQAGYVEFSSFAQLKSQLTTDFASVKTLIDAAAAIGNTNIGDAIDKANLELESSRARSGANKIEILLTDGYANLPGVGDDNPQAVAFARMKADEAKSHGFVLYTIGLGDTVNNGFLYDLASRTGGEYFSSPTPELLTGIYGKIAAQLCGTGQISGSVYNDLNRDGVWQDPAEGVLSGRKVVLMRNGGSFAATFTNTLGKYEFDNLPEAVAFTPVLGDSAGWVTDASPVAPITLSSGQQKLDQNFGSYEVGQSCSADAVSFPVNLALQSGGTNNTSPDDILLGFASTVNGSVYSNHDLRADANASALPVLINGDIKASHLIESGKFLYTGTATPGTPQTALPAVDLSLWKTRAASGGTVTGSLVFPAGTTGIELGPTEILGDLILHDNDQVTVKGPIYVHGLLQIGKNVKITEYASFADQFAVIIVGGTVDIDTGVEFVGSGTLGAFLLASEASAQAGDNAAIELAASDSDLGDAVLYAPNGDIHVNAGRTILAAFAKTGYSDGDPAIRLDSAFDAGASVPTYHVASVAYRTLPSAIGCGPSFTPINQLLINEFMPNPVGDDTQTMPNGEWVELYNGTIAPIDVNGYYLYDNGDSVKIEADHTLGNSTIVPAGGRLVVYSNGQFAMTNTADTVQLYTALKSSGVLLDSKSYNYVGGVPDSKSFSRSPDGTANWVDPEGTPGEPNDEFVVESLSVAEDITFTPLVSDPLPEFGLPQIGSSDYVAEVTEENKQEAEVNSGEATGTLTQVLDGSTSAPGATVETPAASEGLPATTTEVIDEGNAQQSEADQVPVPTSTESTDPKNNEVILPDPPQVDAPAIETPAPAAGPEPDVAPTQEVPAEDAVAE
jgi:uncharacterized protein YegL